MVQVATTHESLLINAVQVLESLMPHALRVDCDRLLGKSPTIREKFTMYQTTFYHYQNRQKTNND